MNGSGLRVKVMRVRIVASSSGLTVLRVACTACGRVSGECVLILHCHFPPPSQQWTTPKILLLGRRLSGTRLELLAR